MNIRSLVTVAVMTVASFGAAGCSGASEEAAPGDTSTEAALRRSGHHGSGVSLSSFKKAMDETAQWADGDCTFNVRSESGKVAVTLTADGSTAEMTVASDDAIKSSIRDDGSTTIYRIAGVGEITVTHADDAFDRVDVVPESGPSATCEIDF